MSATVFLCPDTNCKLKLPSRATLLTHVKMCHTRPAAEEAEVTNENDDSKEMVESDEGEEDEDSKMSLYEDDSIVVKSANVKLKECSICGYMAKNTSDLKRHLKSEHLEQKSYSCPDCGIVVSRKYHLLRHIKAVHEEQKFWQCETCDYKTNNFNCFKRHKHQRAKGGDCDLKYSVESLQNLPPGVQESDLTCVCTWCVFKSNKYSIVKKHIEIYHEKPKSYPCKECLFTAESVDEYAKHYNDFHKTDTYPHACTDCSFRCTNKGDLKQHYIAEHNKQKEYVCRTCKYRTLDYNNMKRHILTLHSVQNVITHKCDYCVLEFESKEDLYSHHYNDHGLHVADINADDMKVVIINEDDNTIYTTV